MKQGKCYIYKRATIGDEFIDYTDGTEVFDCIVDDNGQYPMYTWDLGRGLQIPIPLNIPRRKTDSIIRKGNIDDIEYEFVFGKFSSYPKYYSQQLCKCLPLVLCILLI